MRALGSSLTTCQLTSITGAPTSIRWSCIAVRCSAHNHSKSVGAGWLVRRFASVGLQPSAWGLALGPTTTEPPVMVWGWATDFRHLSGSEHNRRTYSACHPHCLLLGLTQRYLQSLPPTPRLWPAAHDASMRTAPPASNAPNNPQKMNATKSAVNQPSQAADSLAFPEARAS